MLTCVVEAWDSLESNMSSCCESHWTMVGEEDQKVGDEGVKAETGSGVRLGGGRALNWRRRARRRIFTRTSCRWIGARAECLEATYPFGKDGKTSVDRGAVRKVGRRGVPMG